MTLIKKKEKFDKKEIGVKEFSKEELDELEVIYKKEINSLKKEIREKMFKIINFKNNN